MNFGEAVENEPSSRLMLNRALVDKLKILNQRDQAAILELFEEMESDEFQEDLNVGATQYMARVLNGRTLVVYRRLNRHAANQPVVYEIAAITERGSTLWNLSGQL